MTIQDDDRAAGRADHQLGHPRRGAAHGDLDSALGSRLLGRPPTRGHNDNTVTAYDVRYILTSATDKSDGQWTVVDNAWTSGNLTYTITILTVGQSYDVQRVGAKTRAGTGPWSGTGTPGGGTAAGGHNAGGHDATDLLQRHGAWDGTHRDLQ